MRIMHYSILGIVLIILFSSVLLMDTTKPETDHYTYNLYKISDQSPLIFHLPNQLHALRIHVRPIMSMDLPAASKSLSYQLHYQLTAKSGAIIEQRDYTVRQPLAEDMATFYKKKYQLSDSNLITISDKIINLPNIKNCENGTLTLQLVTKDDNIRHIVTEVKVLQDHPIKEEEIRWNRISPEKKKRFEHLNVFGTNSLSQAEIRALTKMVWSSISPVGVEQKDFKKYTVTTDKNILYRPGPTEIKHQLGLPIDLKHHAVITLSKPTFINLEIDPIEGNQ